MRKEFVFAITGGVVIGLIVAFGIWYFDSTQSKHTANQSTPDNTITKNLLSNSTDLKITISEPADLSVLSSNSYSISGVTQPNIHVVAIDDNDEYVTTSDQSGLFTLKLQSLTGAHQIRIFALNGRNSFDTKLTLVYSSEFLASLTPSPSASTSAESILDTVQHKVDQSISKPTSFMGTITDIAENSIQIRTDDDKILQAAFNKETTTFVKTGTNAKELQFSDLAIGDFIVTLGYKNPTDNVLAAKRIIVSDPIKKIQDFAFIAKVDDTTPGDFTLTNLSNNTKITLIAGPNISLSVDPKLDPISRLSNLDEGANIIAIGSLNKDNDFVARRVHLLQ